MDGDNASWKEIVVNKYPCIWIGFRNLCTTDHLARGGLALALLAAAAVESCGRKGKPNEVNNIIRDKVK